MVTITDLDSPMRVRHLTPFLLFRACLSKINYKDTNSYNMHLVLSCYNLMLENILELLDVNEYILFKNQDPEILSFMGYVNGTGLSYKKWKQIKLIVAIMLYKTRGFFAVDCRNL